MATLDTRSFSVITGNIAAAVQGRATQLLDYSIGSVLRAIAEAESGVALWLEGQILRVLLLTRAATSTGADLDTWMADYGVLRLGVNSATGNVQLTRFTTTALGFVPVGGVVRTADLTQSYTVQADPANPYYSASASGFNIPIGIASVTVPVLALTGGSAANALAGTVTVIASNMPGIDIVNNAVAFVGGSDPESDTQLRARFVAYIASLSKATVGALGYAISSLQLGLQYSIYENVDLNGKADNGMVTIVIDDGSGNTPTTVIQNAQSAVNSVRAASIRAGVFAATKLGANISLTVKCVPGYFVANVSGAVATAISTYVNALGLTPTGGASLYYTYIPFLAYQVAGVQEVTNVLLNSGTADLVPALGQVIKCTNVAVSAS